MEVIYQRHAPAASFHGKGSLFPLDVRLCGPQGRAERFEEETNLLSLTGSKGSKKNLI